MGKLPLSLGIFLLRIPWYGKTIDQFKNWNFPLIPPKLFLLLVVWNKSQLDSLFLTTSRYGQNTQILFEVRTSHNYHFLFDIAPNKCRWPRKKTQFVRNSLYLKFSVKIASVTESFKCENHACMDTVRETASNTTSPFPVLAFTC